MKKNNKGFTLVEVLLYIALLVIVLGALFSFGWNMLSVREKASTMRETIGSARLMDEKLKQEIRSATAVDQVNSIFDQDNGKVTLNTADGDVVIASDADKISIQRAGSNPEFLHSDHVRIKNFKLNGEVSGDGSVRFVGYSFSAEAYYPQAGGMAQYQYSTDVRSGAEIRTR